MKRKLLLFAVVMLLRVVLYSQSCLPGGIAFFNQSEIDNFQSNYPGCTEIEGDVTVKGIYITNLLGLSTITSIQGNLSIITATNLENLAGLENLSTLGKSLKIEACSNLTSLTGLEGLIIIEGGLGLFNNNSLQNLTGLENLVSISDGFPISQNDALTSLTGLNSLVSIGMDLSIYDNNQLINLAGIDHLEFIGDDLNITYNDLLENLSGLDSLEIITDEIIITGNNILNSLSGLIGIDSIGGGLSIINNSRLIDLAGIEHLKFIGDDLIITNNELLENLSGLDSLEIITDEIIISSNNNLNSLSELDDLVSVGGGLSIIGNPVLTDCAAQGICDYLLNPNGIVTIYNNASGCANPPQVAGSCGFPTPCLTYGNYYFTSQAQIDNFQNDYPDCTTLNGQVLIQSSNIQNLNGLNKLTAINGNLNISNVGIANFNGLDSLTSISGDLILKINNNNIRTMSGLGNLNSIGGSFKIDDIFLTSFSGIESLTSIGGGFILYQLYQENFSGLENLTSIGGDFDVYENFNLTSFSGLENLTSIGGDFDVYHNYDLTSFSGIENLVYVGDTLNIHYNDRLITLAGLENLTSVKHLVISGNYRLTDISSLNSINPDTLTNLSITNNYSLDLCGIPSICEYLASPNGIVDIHYNINNPTECRDIQHIAASCGVSLPCLPYGNYYFNDQAQIDNFSIDFPDCTELYGDVEISWTITNLDGLHDITAIYGDLLIDTYMENLTGLANLEHIGGDFTLLKTGNILNYNGLENLTSIGGSFYVDYGGAGSSFSGLENLTSIGGSFYIYGIGGVGSSFSGLDNLDSIGGGLKIEFCYIESLIDLSSLSYIGGNLDIHGNYNLTSLEGLEGIDANALDDIYIRGNFVLSFCEIESICNYLAIPEHSVIAYDNATGCNSSDEIRALCGPVGIEQLNPDDGFVIFPNPAEDKLYIINNYESVVRDVKIFNQIGQLVYSNEFNETIDISKLKPGLFIIELITDTSMIRKKIIIN